MTEDLREVLENDLCIGCGACVFADDSLSLEHNSIKQMYEPTGTGNSAANSVCPSIRVDYAQLIKKLYPTDEVGPLGVVKSTWLAQSTDYERNLKASSGGIIKEVVRHLLETNSVDGVISLTHREGILYSPELIHSVDEVDSLPGSVYHSIPFDNALRILRENTGRFALIANPCQLEGIYNYIFAVEPALADKIHMTIGLVCGWTFTAHALKAICHFKGVDFDTVSDVSYRGGGPVGTLRIRAPQKDIEVNRRVDFSYQVSFDRSFNIPRCHLCINHTNVFADLVVADAWLPSTVKTRTGISLALCRTTESQRLLTTLKEAGRIELREVSQEDMVESQTRNVAYGDFSYAYAEYLRSKGLFCPELKGPNRAAAKPVSMPSVAKFHKTVKAKLSLQRDGRYTLLWIRKITLELKPFCYRYLRWFFVRILRINSLIGKRKEIRRSLLKGFR